MTKRKQEMNKIPTFNIIPDMKIGDLVEFGKENTYRFRGIISDICLTDDEVDLVCKTRSLHAEYAVYPSAYGAIYCIYTLGFNKTFRECQNFEFVCCHDINVLGFYLKKI